MHHAKYLIRFDDICSTMNQIAWFQIKTFLNSNQIKPIIAVVPNNTDPDLMINNELKDYWKEIKECQTNGWKIALHGYNHQFVNNNAGIVGRTPRSEFAGVNIDIQREKIKNGIDILDRHGIKSDLWIAPAHSFDKATLVVLKEHGYKYISDGFSIQPYYAYDFLWIPCQQWETIKRKKRGIYTVCIHFNRYDQNKIDRLINNILLYKSDIISFDDVIKTKNHFMINSFTRLTSVVNGKIYNIKRRLIHYFKKRM